jgi:L-fucose dehydrogenase
MACDVADHRQVRTLIERTVELHGRLDCLVNNAAAFTGHRTIDELDLDQVEHLMRVNFIAYFAAAKYALPHLRRVRGSIVNINSIVGEIGAWHNVAYSATKGAGSAFTKSLAIDEAPNGVRVNGVLPGNAVTENRLALEARMTDPAEFHAFAESTQWLGRSADCAEVARVVLFLASDAASFMTGANIPVTGAAELGMSLRVPWPDVER